MPATSRPETTDTLKKHCLKWSPRSSCGAPRAIFTVTTQYFCEVGGLEAPVRAGGIKFANVSSGIAIFEEFSRETKRSRRATIYSLIDEGGLEVSKFAPSSSEISVFEFGGCENSENAGTVDRF